MELKPTINLEGRVARKWWATIPQRSHRVASSYGLCSYVHRASGGFRAKEPCDQRLVLIGRFQRGPANLPPQNHGRLFPQSNPFLRQSNRNSELLAGSGVAIYGVRSRAARVVNPVAARMSLQLALDLQVVPSFSHEAPILPQGKKELIGALCEGYGSYHLHVVSRQSSLRDPWLDL